MNSNLGNSSRANSSQRGGNVNPFAKAMADAERENSSSRDMSPNSNSNSLLSEALSRTGGSIPQNLENGSADDQAAQQQEQLEAMERQKQRDALRKKLHDQVNPTDSRELFSAREKKVTEEINSIRRELELMVKDVKGLIQDVEKAVKEDVVSGGINDGAYHKNFFHKLRSFIILLRQKIKSARTWSSQYQSKKSKKKKGKRPGLEVGGGAAHEKTSMVHNLMHHEQSSAYSGN